MIRIKAEKAKLRRWRRKFSISRQLMNEISKAVAEEAIGLIQDGFREQRDPYGRPWAPKKRPDGRAILVGKTTRLRRGWHVESSKRGQVVIAPSVDYATYHQTGTKHMVARKMVPDRTLPAEWDSAIDEAVLEVLRRNLGE